MSGQKQTGTHTGRHMRSVGLILAAFAGAATLAGCVDEDRSMDPPPSGYAYRPSAAPPSHPPATGFAGQPYPGGPTYAQPPVGFQPAYPQAGVSPATAPAGPNEA